MTPDQLMETCPPQSDDFEYYGKCIGLLAFHVGLRLISRAKIPGEIVHTVETDSTCMNVGFKIIWEVDDERMTGYLARLYTEICSRFSSEDLKDVRAGGYMPVLPETVVAPELDPVTEVPIDKGRPHLNR